VGRHLLYRVFQPIIPRRRKKNTRVGNVRLASAAAIRDVNARNVFVEKIRALGSLQVLALRRVPCPRLCVGIGAAVPI
jgi:hypothetical protein